jgi:hypothetical protein
MAVEEQGITKGIQLMQEVQKIERSIKERREVDIPLINYWLQLFIITPVTMGIYGLILFFKRIGRIDKFIDRKRGYYENIIDFTEKYAQEKGKYELILNELKDLKDQVNSTFTTKIKPINAGVSFLLTLVTFGIWGLIVVYKTNKVWYDLQVIEQEFDDKVSLFWKKLELMKYPISFNIDSSKNRSYALYLILNFITFGIWGIVWDYKMYTDPDNLYKEFHQIEDTVLSTVRIAS